MGACSSKWDLIPNKADIEEPRFVDCQNWDCEYILRVDPMDLLGCYDWEDGDWADDPPGQLADCDPFNPGPSGMCEHLGVVKHGNFATRDACGCTGVSEKPTGENDTICCHEGPDGESASECCFEAPDEAELEQQMLLHWADSYSSIVLALDYPCGIVPTLIADCTPDGVGPNILNGECPPEFISNSIQGDHILEVDPSVSYLTISVFGVGQDTVPLTGGGVAEASGTPSFLFGIVDVVGTSTLGTTTYDDWRFWFTPDIDLNVQTGQFTIPAGQAYVFNGRGLEDSSWVQASFEPLANATGEFGENDWFLDYAVSTANGTVTVHLEGALYGVSMP